MKVVGESVGAMCVQEPCDGSFVRLSWYQGVRA